MHAAVVSAALVGLAPAGALGKLVAACVVALGMAWGSNTVSHIQLHTPLFRARWQNKAYSLYLSALLGIPQSVWRARHLWHHAGEPADRPPRGWTRRTWLEGAVVACVFALLAAWSLEVFFLAYLPGYLLGLGVCRLQGDMEHAATGDPHRGVSYYGAVYNRLWFNDGYHAEHHRFPALHYSQLPHVTADVSSSVGVTESSLPPLLRPLSALVASWNAALGAALCALERLALRSEALQRFLVTSHARAFALVLAALPRAPRRIIVVGGGLFPRTVLVLARLLPNARLVVIDRSEQSIARARAYLGARGLAGRARFVQAAFDPALHCDADLVVTPLAFVGDPELLRRVTSRAPLLSHDWLWRVRGHRSAPVSRLLLKKVSLSLCPEP
ncbi:MAG: fatty acid desaturase [Polyangiaceae bacterium]|nr:fatty acid desaturase [Polyangiaceae bacterium]